jgi:hypothetical protein
VYLVAAKISIWEKSTPLHMSPMEIACSREKNTFARRKRERI